jgi:hypothetical protein
MCVGPVDHPEAMHVELFATTWWYLLVQSRAVSPRSFFTAVVAHPISRAMQAEALPLGAAYMSGVNW